MTQIDAADQICHMQKSSALQPNVDKRRLHARQHPRHFAQVYIANDAPLQAALNMDLLHRAAFNDRDTRFLG